MLTDQLTKSANARVDSKPIFPLRLLMVSNFLSGNGTSRGACEELASHLKDAGCQVITTSTKSQRIARLFDMLRTTWKLRTNYDVAQIDLYSGSAFIWAESVCRLLRYLRKPFVLTLHGGSLPEFSHRYPKRVKRLLSQASVVTAPSDYLKFTMEKYCREITLIPNSIDIDKYPTRERIPLTPRLIWLRSLHRLYNPVQAVEVLARISATYPQAHLSMVGPDKGDGSLDAVRKRAVELGVTQQLTLTGVVPKSEVPHYLDQADIFLNTSTIDNTPISVIEAMCCGLCIVSTDVGGLPHLVHHELEGILVPSRSTDLMSNAILKLLENPDLARQIAVRARQRAESFDWSRTLPLWCEVLQHGHHVNRNLSMNLS